MMVIILIYIYIYIQGCPYSYAHIYLSTHTHTYENSILERYMNRMIDSLEDRCIYTYFKIKRPSRGFLFKLLVNYLFTFKLSYI